MLVVRSLCYHAAFFAMTAALALAGLPLLAGPRRWSRWLGAVWSRAVLWLAATIVGLRFTVDGILPAGPVLIAAKHQSAFETFLFPALRPGSVFVIKRELLRLPFVGWYLARAGQIAIDRTAGPAALRRMLTVARERQVEGLTLVIFPEGTRVAPGVSAAIKPGVLALYGQLNLPVVPVTLDSGRYWPRASFLRRPGTIQVRFGSPIPPGLARRVFQQRLAAALDAAPAAVPGECAA
jgi:1-acyl-sn-glycerol-3-phosphate acyltransferase